MGKKGKGKGTKNPVFGLENGSPAVESPGGEWPEYEDGVDYPPEEHWPGDAGAAGGEIGSLFMLSPEPENVDELPSVAISEPQSTLTVDPSFLTSAMASQATTSRGTQTPSSYVYDLVSGYKGGPDLAWVKGRKHSSDRRRGSSEYRHGRESRDVIVKSKRPRKKCRKETTSSSSADKSWTPSSGPRRKEQKREERKEPKREERQEPKHEPRLAGSSTDPVILEPAAAKAPPVVVLEPATKPQSPASDPPSVTDLAPVAVELQPRRPPPKKMPCQPKEPPTVELLKARGVAPQDPGPAPATVPKHSPTPPAGPPSLKVRSTDLTAMGFMARGRVASAKASPTPPPWKRQGGAERTG